MTIDLNEEVGLYQRLESLYPYIKNEIVIIQSDDDDDDVVVVVVDFVVFFFGLDNHVACVSIYLTSQFICKQPLWASFFSNLKHHYWIISNFRDKPV